MQIKFSSWPRSYSPSWLQSLSPQEQAQVKLHLLYNPVMECSYALPAYEWLSSSPSLDQHYVGDKSLIMSFSYIPPPVQSNQGVNISSSSSSSSSPPLCAPQIKIHWLRVKLDWIISGFEPKIQPTQIYADRYARLYHTLVYQHGCFKYDELSEPVLSYIIEQQDSSTTDISLLPKQLLSYIQEHTHEYQTRLSRLQHMLEGASVDSRMIWKYPFAKSFVIGNGSLLSEEDVLRRIQDSEEEWRLLFGKLKRRFGIL
ncbi:uncharacterized protein BX664DRAFT_255655 [Halteromyces radiatus]|uniref:uncharacterized protein n=1 Tax=Halteromyces radiatus TaxID=101107 RepID=UPI002220F8DB|nr:uncharacterized protein BX664DRAFT_255655 [Halteromyces radiatus]KAI8100152.1 hypothetical protein BX664DRAFT_255655 [Halteromyces radiatus]